MPYTFDNLGASALTLFELSTTENANYLMYPGMDSVSVDHAPVLNYRPYASLFFIAFIAIGSLFLINLFVGEQTPPNWMSSCKVSSAEDLEESLLLVNLPRAERNLLLLVERSPSVTLWDAPSSFEAVEENFFYFFRPTV